MSLYQQNCTGGHQHPSISRQQRKPTHFVELLRCPDMYAIYIVIKMIFVVEVIWESEWSLGDAFCSKFPTSLDSLVKTTKVFTFNKLVTI